jgi:hypothetical protein
MASAITLKCRWILTGKANVLSIVLNADVACNKRRV